MIIKIPTRNVFFWILIGVAGFLAFFPVTCLADGTGLKGDYYTSTNFTGTKTSRTDATVNFDWGTGSPSFGGLGTNNFSIVWSGQIEPRFDETYTFYVTADDGATLWVDDRLIVSRLVTATQTQMVAQIVLRAGKRANIRLEYYETTSNANIRLEWASASQAREVIPQSQLYANTMFRERGTILREHWANLPGTAITNLTSYTNYPNKPDGREMFLSFECLQTNWSTNIGTRVSGYLIPLTNGAYTFAVAAADVAQLWLSTDTNPANKQLIAGVSNATAFRDWSDQVSQVSTGIPLIAWQKYYVELLHKAGASNNHYSVAWKQPGSTQFSVIDADYLVPPGLSQSLPAQANIFDRLAQSHPRLFATAERFAWLKQQVATNSAGQPAKWYASVYSDATKLLNTAPVTYTAGNIQAQSWAVKTRIYQLGLAWKISGDTNFAERAWTELNAAGNFPDWNSSSYLFTAEMTGAFGLGYDWFYEYWSDTQKNFILTNITSKGLATGLNQFNSGAWWTSSLLCNWNMVCNGGLTLGALAVGTDAETTAEQILSKTIPSQASAMPLWTCNNGAWFEGPHYANYAGDYNFRMLAGLQSALGTDFGLSMTNGVNNAGLYEIVQNSVYKRNFNFSDAMSDFACGPELFWWARRFNMPVYACYGRTNNSAYDAMNVLLWDGRGGDLASENIESDFLFLGPTGTTKFNPQHVGVFRSSWGDPHETMLCFKGGEMGATHGHLDAGSFVLEAMGQRWACDLGYDNYSLSGYGEYMISVTPNRWYYYRARAEGHNTVVINPGYGPDMKFGPNQSPGPVAQTINYQSKPGVRSLAVIDMTPIASNVVRAWRGFQLFGPGRKQVLVQDEIVSSSATNVWWFMHYQSSVIDVSISSDSNSVMMTQGSARLWGKIISSNASFQIMSAHPLPTSPDPSGQDTNSNYSKLAIHLTGISNTTVAVWFVPLEPGQNPPLVAPAITPLSQWQIPEDDPPVAEEGAFTTPQNTPIDVDLTTLASDTITASSNLIFTVFNPTNGTVALLPDGHTARFTPATNYFGDAQFLYTVTDSGSNTTTAGITVTVQPGVWYWDSSADAGLQPGNGIWDGATASWSASVTGSSPLLTWSVPGNDAVFVGSGGSYAVTINNTQQVNQITTTNGTWTFSGGALQHSSGDMTMTIDGNASLNSPLFADTDFVKAGAGTLSLGAPVSFSGDILAQNGTLRSSVNNTLPITAALLLGADANAGALDFASGSQTLGSLTVITTNSTLTNAITIGSGQTLKINGPMTVGVDNGSVSVTRLKMSGAGALVVTNTGGNVTVGLGVSVPNSTNGNTASLDCSKLASVTLGTTNVPLSELRIGYGNGTGTTTHNFTMSDTNNSIVATTVQVGNSLKNNGSSGTLILGSGTNVIKTDTLNIGLCKVAGTVKFASQTAGSPGMLTLSGKSGAATTIWVGYKNATGTGLSPSSTLDLRGHNVTITAGSLFIGVEDGSSTGGDSGTVYFDGGTFTATNVTIGSKGGTSTGTASGTLNISGGVFTMNAGGKFTLGVQTNVGSATAVINLTGGTLDSHADILDGGGSVNSTFMLNGGTLNLFGYKLGSTTNINTINMQAGTLLNIGEINAGAPLVKTGTGTLVMAGTNKFTGGAIVTAGTLQLGGIMLSSVTVSNATLTGSGTVSNTLTLTSGSTFQPRINGYLPGTNYDQIAVSGAITLNGALNVSVTNAAALPTGHMFTIIRNNSAVPVSGTFTGLPQMATFTNATLVWRINYQGGDGNDVTLTLLSGGTAMPPTVTLTAPTNGASVSTSLVLTATASSSFGIASVEFYSGALLLGSDATSPYTWTNKFVPGPHTFIVVARDINGQSATDTPVNVMVVGTVPSSPQLSAASCATDKPEIQVAGPAGYFYFVDVSTNLTNAVWTNVFSTNLPSLPFIWTDNDTNMFIQRFYRVRVGS